MSLSLFTTRLNEARRDALVNQYLATHDFSSLPVGSSVKTADDLYEYLLLDTKISSAVTTSRLADAISSLQLCIHRALEGYDGELATGATPLLAQDAFLDNWDKYNKRYSTWAGKEKLRFYAGNYVEPSLRVNKTELFKKMEQALGAGRVSLEQAEKAVRGYISEYNSLAGISYLQQGSGESDNIFYLTGKNADTYFWRKVVVNNEGMASMWGDWFSLPTSIASPINDKVVVSYSPAGIICQWLSREKNSDSTGEMQESEFLNEWKIKSDESWGVNKHNAINYIDFNVYSSATWKQISSSSISVEINHEHDTLHTIKASLTITYDGTRDKLLFKIIHIDAMSEKLFVTAGSMETMIYLDKDLELNDAYNNMYVRTGSESYDYARIGGINLSPTVTPAGYFHDISDGKLKDIKQQDIAILPPPEDARNLLSLNDGGIPDLFDYLKQNEIVKKGAWDISSSSKKSDVFSGPYGHYLWEIFFHIPYLVASRFATEQRFEEAERWYKYIFNSASYRDEDGKIQTDEKGNPRYWNCYPLQQDMAWDSFADMPASTDPDVIATVDPMHYKLAIFRHTLDLLITRGDAAYRLLERDTLTEAKMYYVQAQQLLGPPPDIRATSSWGNPTLAAEAGSIMTPMASAADRDVPTFAQWLRAGDVNDMGDGGFLPPYNDVLLAYWDKLDIRLYNLRHNLSLDGQPLNLPLYATLVDPAELHRQQSGGDDIQEDVSPAAHTETGWRYPLLADHARYAVGQLSQFGSTLLAALEKQDAEKVTLLLQSQQENVLSLQQDIAQKNLDSLTADLSALNSNRESAQLRKKYYDALINGDLSAAEISGLALRSSAMISNTASTWITISGGIMSAIPNTFGLANGGADFGAPLHATAQAMQTAALTLDQSASISEVTAGYQRRREDWKLQRDIADEEISQADAGITGLKAQIAMQQKQIALAEMEYANARAYQELYNSCFTGLSLYSWMVSRLSALYYQLYDATVPVCIQAREALKRELGKNQAGGIFTAPVWNDLYQGLLAGEGLTTELQKLDNLWLQNSAKGLEATRTVSLAALRGEKTGNLSAAIGSVLAGKADSTAVGKLAFDSDSQIFRAVLDMAGLNLVEDYGDTSKEKALFVKSITVTLPTLLGPYQDIAATLSDGKGTVATLSHGMADSGRFVVNLDDNRFLPFEGADPRALSLTLSIFNVKDADEAVPNQRAIVENLSDIIFHVRYIMRDERK
jgi:hypothetical protein